MKHSRGRVRALLLKPYALFLLFLVLLSIIGPTIAPNDPFETHVSRRLSGPSRDFPFGTDDLGRCVLSRMLAGARISLGMGVLILSITLSTGSLLGILAGYTGGFFDEVVMRITDVFMTVPSFVIALVLIRTLGSGVMNIVLVFSLTMWTRYARMTRSLVLNLRHENYIRLARLTGLSRGYILRRHVLPAVVHPLVVMGTLGMGMTILMTSSLSFLGLGITEPVPDWGAMLNKGTTFIRTAPHIAIFAGLAIALTVFSLNLLGEALRRGYDRRPTA